MEEAVNNYKKEEIKKITKKPLNKEEKKRLIKGLILITFGVVFFIIMCL